MTRTRFIIIFIVIILAIILVAGGVFYFSKFEKTMINIPYFGFYTHNADLQGSPTGAMLASVLSYYGKNVTGDELKRLKILFPNSKLTSSKNIVSYLREKGVDANVVSIKNEAQLRETFQKFPKSPILIIQSPSRDYPGTIHILRLIKGYDPSSSQVVLNDYYEGPDIQMTAEDLIFLATQKLSTKYQGMAIVPLGTPIGDFKQPQLHQSKKDIVKVSQLLKKQLWAFEAAGDFKNTDALSTLDGILKSSDFDLLPKANRAYTYGLYGMVLTNLRNFPEAIESLKKSVELNSDLDKADRYWQPYEKSAYPDSSFYLGEAYRLSGDALNAKKYYQGALEIDPTYISAKDALSKVEKVRQ